jgi:hypothetical protein
MKVMIIESVNINERSNVVIDSMHFVNYGQNMYLVEDVRISFGSTKDFKTITSKKESVVLKPHTEINRSALEPQEYFKQMDACKAIMFKDVVCSFNERKENIKFVYCLNSKINLFYNATKKKTIVLKATNSEITIHSSNNNTRFKISDSDIDSVFNLYNLSEFSHKNICISPEIPTQLSISQRMFMTTNISCNRPDIIPITLMTDQSIAKFFRKNINMPSESSSSRHGRNHNQRRVIISSSWSPPLHTIDLTKEERVITPTVAKVPEFAFRREIEGKYVSCLVCETYAATVTTSPCLHDVLCTECYDEMDRISKTNRLLLQCPICKAVIVDKMFAAPYSVQREIKTTE